MTWQLQFTSRARRDFRRLSDQERSAVRRALDRAVIDATQVDIKKLRGSHNGWRIRVGRLRVILELDNRQGIMTVTQVVPRDRAYRN